MKNKNHRDFIAERKDWYKNIKSVYCPALSINVVFNAKGFDHILYNGLGHLRNKNESVQRFGLLPNAIAIIKKAHNVGGYRSTFNINSQRLIEYWSLKKGKGSGQITVILRKVGNGNVIFYSVWKKSR